MNDLFQNDFFDANYAEAELPDDFFSCAFKNFKDDPIIKCSKEADTVGGIKASHFHYFDYDASAVVMGPAEVSEPFYVIDHDETVVNCVLEWYEKFVKGSNDIFPDVPIADPQVPPNMLEKQHDFVLQQYLMTRGYVLGNPTATEIKELGDYGKMAAEDPIDPNIDLLTMLPLEKKVFFPYIDRVDKDRRTLTMQFNPFTPMSFARIRSIIRESEFVYVGQYRLNHKDYPFKFDFLSDYYRVHPDQWMPLVGTDSSISECFDLVGNFDFLSDFTYKARVIAATRHLGDGYKAVENDINLAVKERRSIVQPYFVEPFFTSRIAKVGYSVIGPWPGEIVFGVEPTVFYTPYITPQLEVSSRADSYADITSEVRRDDKDFDLYYVRGHAYRKGNFSPYFLRTFKNGEYRVFERSAEGPFGFIEVPFRVYSYPNNGKESIIYPFRFSNLISLFSVRKHIPIKEYLPLSVFDRNDNVAVQTNIQVDGEQIIDVDEMLEDMRLKRTHTYYVRGTLGRSDCLDMISDLEKKKITGFLTFSGGFLFGELTMDVFYTTLLERYIVSEVARVDYDKLIVNFS